MDDKVHEGVTYMKEKKTILIQCDNQGTISLSKNQCNMFEQNTLIFNIIFNIILLDNELKMVKCNQLPNLEVFQNLIVWNDLWDIIIDSIPLVETKFMNYKK
jgi:hypothetical protein